MLDALTLTDLKDNSITAIAFRDYLLSPHYVVRDYAQLLQEAGASLAGGEKAEAQKHLDSANMHYHSAVQHCFAVEFRHENGNSDTAGDLAHNTWRGDCSKDFPPSQQVALNLAYLEHLASCYEEATGNRFDTF
jgi:hypothetical protein